MPINYIPGKGYRYGESGKIYPNREDAIKQMKAIKAAQSKEENKKKNKSLKQKRLEKKQEEENKLKKQEDLKNIVENIENLIESYKDDGNKLDIKDIINDEEFKDFEVYNMENFDKYKEIFIIGLPGSGKTTISEKISKKYNIPVYHLDDLWKEKYFEGLSDNEADIKLTKFLDSHSKPIIFEGVQPLLVGAYDYFKNKPIVILKSSIFISSFRAFKRSFHPDYERKFLDLYYILHDNFDFSKKLDTFKRELGLDNISVVESYESYVTNNTFSRNGITYDVDKLIKLTHKNKPIYFNINLLKEFLLKNPIYNTKYHQDRIYQADLSAPILVWKSHSNVWNIIDGKHRVQKALDEGKEALPAYVISDSELEASIKYKVHS